MQKIIFLKGPPILYQLGYDLSEFSKQNIQNTRDFLELMQFRPNLDREYTVLESHCLSMKFLSPAEIRADFEHRAIALDTLILTSKLLQAESFVCGNCNEAYYIDLLPTTI